MADTTYTNANRIALSSGYVLDEKTAGGTIKPGMLVERYNSSGTQLCRAHSTAKGFAEAMFAEADFLQGRTIDDNYVVTELVRLVIMRNGERVQAWLAPGTNYVKGDKLESAGNGNLQKISGSADLEIVAILEEAKDLSASGAVATRADVRVL